MFLIEAKLARTTQWNITHNINITLLVEFPHFREESNKILKISYPVMSKIIIFIEMRGPYPCVIHVSYGSHTCPSKTHTLPYNVFVRLGR